MILIINRKVQLWQVGAGENSEMTSSTWGSDRVECFTEGGLEKIVFTSICIYLHK